MNKKNTEQSTNSLEELNEKTGIISEFWEFLCENKKFWLIPILLLLIFLAIFLCASPAISPFIYALF